MSHIGVFRLETPSTPPRRDSLSDFCTKPLSSPSRSLVGRKRGSMVSSCSPRRGSRTGADRFIPERGSKMSMDILHARLMSPGLSPDSSDGGSAPSSPSHTTLAREEYKRTLRQNMVESGSESDAPRADAALSFLDDPLPGADTAGDAHARRAPASPALLNFHSPAASHDPRRNPLRAVYFDEAAPMSPLGSLHARREVSAVRTLPTAADQVLEAPDLMDDFYLNLLDWGAGDKLAVALANTVYIWDGKTHAVKQLLNLGPRGEPFVTSVRFSDDGRALAVGTSGSEVQTWDVEAGTQIRALVGHASRVGCLAWRPAHPALLCSGSRDSFVFLHDVRIARHHVGTLQGHGQEVCGMEWSHDGSQLATGGNDNLLLLWDAATAAGAMAAPVHTLAQHAAAVKALAWCPWAPNLLASGGGTADRHIRFWNTVTGSCLNAIDTRSQVCALRWSLSMKEIVSSHGFSQNQLTVWSYPTMQKLGDLTGHTARVLHMSMSPDGSTVVSAAADETLRFWKLFPAAGNATSGGMASPQKKGQGSMLRLRVIR